MNTLKFEGELATGLQISVFASNGQHSWSTTTTVSAIGDR